MTKLKSQSLRTRNGKRIVSESETDKMNVDVDNRVCLFAICSRQKKTHSILKCFLPLFFSTVSFEYILLNYIWSISLGGFVLFSRVFLQLMQKFIYGLTFNCEAKSVDSTVEKKHKTRAKKTQLKSMRSIEVETNDCNRQICKTIELNAQRQEFRLSPRWFIGNFVVLKRRFFLLVICVQLDMCLICIEY